MPGSLLRAFEVSLLVAIARVPPDHAYGLGLHDRLESDLDRTIALGQIYTSLARLEANGYVRTRLGDGTSVRGGRRRKFYTVTAEGRAALQSALGQYRDIAARTEATLPHLQGLDP